MTYVGMNLAILIYIWFLFVDLVSLEIYLDKYLKRRTTGVLSCLKDTTKQPRVYSISGIPSISKIPVTKYL